MINWWKVVALIVGPLLFCCNLASWAEKPAVFALYNGTVDEATYRTALQHLRLLGLKFGLSAASTYGILQGNYIWRASVQWIVQVHADAERMKSVNLVTANAYALLFGYAAATGSWPLMLLSVTAMTCLRF